MAKMGECFVCGISLAQVGKARAEVTDAEGDGPATMFCMGCWRKVSKWLKMLLGKEGISYLVVVKYWRAAN